MLENLRSAIFFSILLTVGAAIEEHGRWRTFPVFNVEPAGMDGYSARRLAGYLFGEDDYYYNNTLPDEEHHIFVSSDGTKRVEYDTISGAIWAVDESELWNTEGPAPELPTDAEAISMADALVGEYNLLPTEEGPVRVSSGYTSKTFLAHEYKPKHGSNYTREEYPLDISVNYDITLSIPGLDSQKDIPIVGGGGKFRVTFGNGGKLIAFRGLWRKVVGNAYDQSIPPQATLDHGYQESLGCLSDTADFNSTLAYFSAPVGCSQKQLHPVFVYSATFQVGSEEFGALQFSHEPQYPRTGPVGIPSSSFTAPTISPSEPTISPSEPTVSPSAPTISPGPPGPLETQYRKDDGKLEAAAEWLGKDYGLPMAEENCAGFKEGILKATPNWALRPDRSDEDVLTSDFTTKDDKYADAVDLLFYAGHANMNGWMANKPGPIKGEIELIHYSSFGKTPENPGDLLGTQDLEWLVIAAAGPHQDRMFDPCGGNVFDRWRGIFDGLHIMLAYGSESYDTTDEGRKLMQYAREGHTLINSWFRAAMETQPPGVVVTAMWTTGPGGNARNDHLPGYGWVSEDNVGECQERWFMSTSC